MKISIITAVYNRVATIDHAIESVQAQSYAEVEHIVQDGGSTDGTLEMIHKRACPETALVSEVDSGIYDAINRGIARSRGDVIGLMHSDDFFASHLALEWIAEAFADPNVDGVYGDLNYVSASDPTKIVRKWRSGEYREKRLAGGWMPPHPTLYLRRHVFEQWGLYNTEYRIAADYDAILRYLIQGQIRLAYIPKVLVNMRVGGESNRSLQRIAHKSREDFHVIRRHKVGGLCTLVFKNLSKIKQFI